jgi:hypothetical protein
MSRLKLKPKRVQDILKKNQKSISKEGVAAYDAAAKKALEDKYPGMYIPETRITPGINRSR